MNKNKEGALHDVYLVNDEYGMRGVDYRSPFPSAGICLIIGAKFGDKREEIQGLCRVGRMGDKCWRIFDTDLGDSIDSKENAARKARLYQGLEKIEEDLKQIEEAKKNSLPLIDDEVDLYVEDMKVKESSHVESFQQEQQPSENQKRLY